MFNCGADNKTMKKIIVLFAESVNHYSFEKSFGKKSAFERSMELSSFFDETVLTLILCTKENRTQIESLSLSFKNVKIIDKDFWSCSDVVGAISEECESFGASCAVFSWADCPFISKKLSLELMDMHLKYKAEYTFADGFPYGLAPEIIDSGAAKILYELCKDTCRSAGEKQVGRDCIFSIMSSDINSFEIETLISEKDYRSYRFEFECSSKAGFYLCTNVYKKLSEQNISDELDFDAIKLSDTAVSLPNAIQNLPAFYNIQISAKNNTKSVYDPLEQCAEKLFKRDEFSKLNSFLQMNFCDFEKLLKKISDFSETAVIGLSCFGEPLLNDCFYQFAEKVLSYPKFSLFIETSGLEVTEELAQKIALAAQKNNFGGELGNINWAVCIDSSDSLMYEKIHGIDGANYQKVVSSVAILSKYFPKHVYPQFTRMNANENQLESFYRFWKEKENPSGGILVIQKYDNLAGILPDEKPADLSPLERNVCWHIRRDFVVLCDGSVPVCRTRAKEIFGNAFTDELDEIWKKIGSEVEKQMKNDYCKTCRACDEYYTFNF